MSGALCPWDKAPVEREGVFCDADCYFLMLTWLKSRRNWAKKNGTSILMLDEDMPPILPWDQQPWTR